MYLPTTHIAFGVLGSILSSFILRVPLTREIVVLGMITSVFPDIDYVYYLARFGIRPAKYSHEHRQAITHSLFPYFVIAVLIFFFGNKVWGVTFFLASLSHLILDSVRSPWGIRWFWPFSNQYYSLNFKSGFHGFTKKQLDKFTNQRSNKAWVDRCLKWDNPYFRFEFSVIIFLSAFLFFFFFKYF